MRTLRVTEFRSLPAILWLTFALGSASVSGQTVNVTTWHNDIGRTGQNTNETALTYSSVTKSIFGKICSAALDGKQIHAQH